MKNLTLFIPSLAIAGAEKFVVDLAIHIDKKFINPTIALTTNNKRTAFTELAESHNIRIVDLSSKNKLKAVFNVFKYLRKYKPDIIHVNVAALQYVAIPSMFINIKKKYYTVHGAAQRLAQTPLRKLLYTFCFKILNYQTVAISSYVKRTIHEVYNIDLTKIHYNGNGVDTRRYLPSTDPRNDSTLRIISTGTLYDVKNHKLLIDSFYGVSKKYPNVEMVILGDGELKSKLEKQIAMYNLETKVHLLGKVSNPEQYLASADIYVGTSLFEGFSLAALEAMSCGLPVIFTKAGGVSDIVLNNENGYLCDFDADEIANCICYLTEHPKIRKKFSDKSIEIAKQYDIKKFAEGYLKLYLS